MSKFVAHHDRGGSDPRASQDFEDIVYILDNRTDWPKIIKTADHDVRTYLSEQFLEIKESDRLREAILGNLYYETQEVRFKMIMGKLNELLEK